MIENELIPASEARPPTNEYISVGAIACDVRYIYPGTYRDNTMADNLMYIPNDDTQNYFF